MADQEIIERLNKENWIKTNFEALPESSGWQHMLATKPIFVGQKQLDDMHALIKTVTKLSENPVYQELVLKQHPELYKLNDQSKGVFFGYDFHLTENGAKLIEVNTNAGAAYLNHLLNQSQEACCTATKKFMRSPLDNRDDFENLILSMFNKEYALSRPGNPLKTVAILDENPEEQFLHPEFLMFQALFESSGVRAFIVDPSELQYDGKRILHGRIPIDLIYNRHTDFYLKGENLSQIRQAYLDQHVVLTPSPKHYALAADKSLLSLWSDPDFLDAIHLSEGDKAILLDTIPHTQHLSEANADTLWQNRKDLFFKPTNGFGSKATYKGAKLTKTTWDQLVKSGNFIAQEFIAPSQHTLDHEGEPQAFKIDFRNYAYDGETLLASARLYRGQVTNMKTPGGGFATVYSVR